MAVMGSQIEVSGEKSIRDVDVETDITSADRNGDVTIE